MGEYLTIEEIYKKFDSEWELLANPKMDEELKVWGGEVLAHGKDENEVLQRLLEIPVELRPKHLAWEYTGKLPECVLLKL